MDHDPRRSQRERLERAQSRDSHPDSDIAAELTSSIRRAVRHGERHSPDLVEDKSARSTAAANTRASRSDTMIPTVSATSSTGRGFLGFNRSKSLLNHAVDALRKSPLVETHRSSSGRNLRLKHVPRAQDELIVASNALMPRAPSGRRPEVRQSARRADTSNNSRSPSENRERRSSFSISAHALKELERSRSSTASPRLRKTREEPEQHEGQEEEEDQDQQREHQSEGSYEDDWEAYNEEDGLAEANNPEPLLHAHDDEEVEEKPVACFGLWGKAAKNKRLPNAIIFSGVDNTGMQHAGHPQPAIQAVSTPPSSSKSEPSAREMVSQLQGAHPGLGALAAYIPESLSLTRSTSPRIGHAASASLSRTSSRSPRTSAASHSGERGREVETTKTHSKPITKWKRGELIGEGTFGKVYMGLNSITGELFAIKEIEIRTSPNADQVTQMQKLGEEIALMNNLCHKHIVRYKGSHRTANHFYIFMEYVPGGSIASMLKQFDAFSEDLIRIFTRQIVQGVVYLHRMGIIHRDIKGANVLVNEQGISKLADFGCSKQIPQMLTTSLEESLRAIRGSIPWMAPEVVKQTGHDYKADVWSIGATVVEMATAQHPWPECHNGLSAMYAIAMATSAPPLPEHLSGEAKAFLRRCFCVNPEERATAAELAAHAFLAPTS